MISRTLLKNYIRFHLTVIKCCGVIGAASGFSYSFDPPFVNNFNDGHLLFNVVAQTVHTSIQTISHGFISATMGAVYPLTIAYCYKNKDMLLEKAFETNLKKINEI